MMPEITALLDLIKQGDENAFADLCEMNKNLTDGAVHRFLPSFTLPGSGKSDLYGEDDLRQYAVLALYKAAVTYDADGAGKKVSFGLYAKICVNNALISQLRKHKSEQKRLEAAKKAELTKKRESDPFQRIAGAEGAEKLLAKIGEVLSGYEKEIFEYYIDGKSVREIAERLGKDEKSVSNALYRMKVKVRGLLKIQ